MNKATKRLVPRIIALILAIATTLSMLTVMSSAL